MGVAGGFKERRLMQLRYPIGQHRKAIVAHSYNKLVGLLEMTKKNCCETFFFVLFIYFNIIVSSESSAVRRRPFCCEHSNC